MKSLIISKFETVGVNSLSSWSFFLLLFLCVTKVYSQSEKSIEGGLTDESGEKIMSASVLLKDSSGEIITYAISDANGKFVLKITLPGTYILEVTHISFALYSETIVLTDSKVSYSYDIVLESKGNALNEVVIQGRRAAAKQRGDTLSYSINAFTTGNEQKLKDIIKKLPGLEIDESGKIKAEGKTIDNLLVDGKPFFGNNHKIATDNLNAKMVDGIDLLKNYEKFDAIKEIEGSNETALNIQIKEEYKGKPTGNLEAYGAYRERYRLHTNLFSFAKTHNLSFIGNLNNTGQQPVSLLDYIQMDKSKEIKNKEDEISSINPGSNLPSFLINNDNRSKQQSKFGALNAVFAPFKNIAVEAFSLLNIEKIKNKQFSERQYFSQTETLFSNEFIQEENDFLINQTNINVEYKPTTNSLLNYTLDYKPKKNEYFTKIDGEVEAEEQNTLQKIKTNGHILGQNLSYTTRLDSNKLFAINAFSNYHQENTKLSLLSNQSLFDMGNSVTQQIANKNEEYGLYSRYTQRAKNHIIKFNFGYVWEEDKFYDTAFPDENIALSNRDYLYTGASVEKKEGFFQYKALLNIRNYRLSYNHKKDNSWLFLPALESKLEFSKTHYISFKYRRQAGFPNANQLNPFSYVVDYRNFRLNSATNYSKPIINNHLDFQYFYFNLYSGTQILFNSFYSETENNIGVNNEIIGNYNYSNALNTPSKRNWVNRLRFQTRINPIKTIFKIEIDYTHTVLNNYVNATRNKATNKQYRVKPFLSSYFKDAWLNYEIGVDFEKNNTLFALTELENKGSKTSPFVNLNGGFSKSWSYYINNRLSYYKTSTTERDFHQLDFELRYAKNKSKFNYWISGENILNITNTQIVEAVALQNSISKNIIYRMPGYIGAGISYDF